MSNVGLPSLAITAVWPRRYGAGRATPARQIPARAVPPISLTAGVPCTGQGSLLRLFRLPAIILIQQRLLSALWTISGHANLDGTSVHLSMTPELLHGVSLRACPSCGKRNCARSPENPKLRGNPLCAHPMRGARALSDRRSRRDRPQDRRASRSKNRLFAGSEGGGPTCATVATILQTAKMNGVDPFAWLSQTLIRIAQRWPVPKSKCSCPGTSS